MIGFVQYASHHIIYTIYVHVFMYFEALECNLVPLEGRVDCSTYSGTESSCIENSCCYDVTSQPGVPDCYYPAGMSNNHCAATATVRAIQQCCKFRES